MDQQSTIQKTVADTQEPENLLHESGQNQIWSEDASSFDWGGGLLAAESPQGDGNSGAEVVAIGTKGNEKERKIANHETTIA